MSDLIRHRLPDGTLWPDVRYKDPENPGVEWCLRYALEGMLNEPDKVLCFQAASVVHAYEQLIRGFDDETAHENLRQLREAARSAPDEKKST